MRWQDCLFVSGLAVWVCSLDGRAVASKAAGRGFESLRTRIR